MVSSGKIFESEVLITAYLAYFPEIKSEAYGITIMCVSPSVSRVIIFEAISRVL
jgi:hypothetical protein